MYSIMQKIINKLILGQMKIIKIMIGKGEGIKFFQFPSS